MTKIIEFNGTEGAKKETKIKLLYYIDRNDGIKYGTQTTADSYENVMLVPSRNSEYNTILCWDDPDNIETYIGHWNDGVV